uniref:Uncharacterized protein n=1 Tax=Anguilla anguilla TaxID=7936 RepID=A0A0E9X7H7_ANGAN
MNTSSKYPAEFNAFTTDQDQTFFLNVQNILDGYNSLGKNKKLILLQLILCVYFITLRLRIKFRINSSFQSVLF